MRAANPFLQDQAEVIRSDLVYTGKLSNNTQLIWRQFGGYNPEGAAAALAEIGEDSAAATPIIADYFAARDAGSPPGADSLEILYRHRQATKNIETIESILGFEDSELTGTLEGLTENFRDLYYTVDCLEVGHTESFCLVPAVQHGDINTVKTILDQVRARGKLLSPIEYVEVDEDGNEVASTPPQFPTITYVNQIQEAIVVAIQEGNLEMVELLRPFLYVDDLMPLSKAIKAGRPDIFQYLWDHHTFPIDDDDNDVINEEEDLAEDALRHRQWDILAYILSHSAEPGEVFSTMASFAGQYGSVEALDVVLAATTDEEWRHELKEIAVVAALSSHPNFVKAVAPTMTQATNFPGMITLAYRNRNDPEVITAIMASPMATRQIADVFTRRLNLNEKLWTVSAIAPENRGILNSPTYAFDVLQSDNQSSSVHQDWVNWPSSVPHQSDNNPSSVHQQWELLQMILPHIDPGYYPQLLHRAIGTRNDGIAALLAKSFPDAIPVAVDAVVDDMIKIVDRSASSPVQQIQRGQQDQLLRSLQTLATNTTENSTGTTSESDLLVWAAAIGSLRLVDYLLSRGVDPAYMENSALLAAEHYNHPEIIARLGS